MGLSLITAPAAEPITLAEAKAHCRVDFNDDDALIFGLIITMRQRAEAITRRALIAQQWRYTTDAFPTGALITRQWRFATNTAPYGQLALPKPPLISVDSVKYLDAAGVLQTLAPSAYDVHAEELMGSIVPVYGTTWPDTRSHLGAVQVDFTAGYASAAAVPQSIKTWMLCYIAAAYENRASTITGRSISAIDLPFVDSLLDDYLVDAAL
jgi:uncharacterized phiE125 gp8 family phage protein